MNGRRDQMSVIRCRVMNVCWVRLTLYPISIFGPNRFQGHQTMRSIEEDCWIGYTWWKAPDEDSRRRERSKGTFNQHLEP